MTSNVELARAGYEAVARGDVDALRPLLAADVKWHGGDESAPEACRGSAEVLEVVSAAGERGGIGELVDVVDAGDRVVVILRPPATEEGDAALRANVTTFRDGRVIEMVGYETPDEAFAAVGN
jgi:ketosteroid isomerase-like protein